MRGESQNPMAQMPSSVTCNGHNWLVPAEDFPGLGDLVTFGGRQSPLSSVLRNRHWSRSTQTGRSAARLASPMITVYYITPLLWASTAKVQAATALDWCPWLTPGRVGGYTRVRLNWGDRWHPQFHSHGSILDVGDQCFGRGFRRWKPIFNRCKHVRDL